MWRQLKSVQNMVWASASMSCHVVEPDLNYALTPPTLMPRPRKRKQPIARVADVAPVSSTSAQSCRTVIRQFHVLLKKKRQLEQQASTGGVSLTAVAEIDTQIKELGGLEHYQQLSVLGQSHDRGGGSEKVFIKWLKELEMHKSAAKLRFVPSRHSENLTHVKRLDCWKSVLLGMITTGRARHGSIVTLWICTPDILPSASKTFSS